MSIGNQIHKYETANVLDISDADAVTYWANKLRVSADELLNAVWKVGPQISDVVIELSKS